MKFLSFDFIWKFRTFKKKIFNFIILKFFENFEILYERGRGVKVQNWPHIILKNNARHRIKTIY
jgi:hypothetical protein